MAGDTKMRKKEIIVIGGGASGMIAAMGASSKESKVLLLEQKDRVGKKLLSTGNGKCNLTNSYQGKECYRGRHPEFAFEVFRQFSYEDTIAFFSKLGIYIKNKNQGIYPFSEQASAVVDVLRMGLSEHGVRVHTGQKVLFIEKKKRFIVQTEKERWEGDGVIIASGGKAAPMTGSDGWGYELAKNFGHHIIQPLPALTQLVSKERFLKGLAGVRCEAVITLYLDGKEEAKERGELQLVDYGLSGIPIFQLSRFAARGIYEKKKALAAIQFLPDMKEEEGRELMTERIRLHPKRRGEELFTGLFHKKLSSCLLKRAGIKGDSLCGEWKKEEVLRLVELIFHFPVSIERVNTFEKAQVTMGGVDTRELKETLESKKVPGLFFAGEIIDIDGMCGGYNLQWAWSSGYVAGINSIGVK